MKKATILLIICLLAIGSQAKKVSKAAHALSARTADSLYFTRKKALMTAVWNKPFSFSSVHSNNAPKGPYLGNGDVGIATYTSENSQTLQVSKVDFVTDGWSDWAGNGPAALPVGGITITVNSPVYYKYISTNRPDTTSFRYEMDQYESELRMRTGTAQQVRMRSWMGMDDNFLVTELRSASDTPVLVSVMTFANSQNPIYHTTATGVPNGTTSSRTCLSTRSSCLQSPPTKGLLSMRRTRLAGTCPHMPSSCMASIPARC